MADAVAFLIIGDQVCIAPRAHADECARRGAIILDAMGEGNPAQAAPIRRITEALVLRLAAHPQIHPRVDLAPTDAAGMRFLSDQVLTRQALAPRLLRRCTTCGHTTVINPEHQARLVAHRKYKGVVQAVNDIGCLAIGGVTPLMRRAMSGLLPPAEVPEYVCPQCHGLEATDVEAVLCPACSVPNPGPMLFNCVKCGLAFAERQGSKLAWKPMSDVARIPPPHRPATHSVSQESAVTDVSFVPGDGSLVTASDDGVVRLDAPAQPVVEFRVPRAVGLQAGRFARVPVAWRRLRVAVSADGQYLVAAGMSATARTFHLADGSPGAALEHAAGLKARGMGKGLLPVLALAFHPSDPIVLTGCADRTARLWDVRDGRELLRLQHQGPVLSTAVSGDGRFVATGSGLVEKGACVFDARSGERLRVIPHAGDVLDVCFGADGSELVTVCGDGWVRLWDAGSNEPRLVWSVQHAGKVRALTSYPGGHFYVTAGDDWTARVWSPADGREWARVSAASVIVAVAVSQDGRRIATAAGTTAQVWDVMSSAPDGDAGRPLTAQMS